MMEVTLDVNSPQGAQQISVTEERFTIGRSDKVSLMIDDDGLSRVHASINREGDHIWVLDEGSTNGSSVNGSVVPPTGLPLRDGDQILIGNHTSIVVRLNNGEPPPKTELITPVTVSSTPSEPASFHWLAIALPIVAFAFLIGIVVFTSGPSKTERQRDENGVRAGNPTGNEDRARPDNQSLANAPGNTTAEASTNAQTAPDSSSIADNSSGGVSSSPEGASSVKLYRQMTPEEQVAFIEERARHISRMMSNGAYEFNEDVLRYIKQYVDGYARRVGNNSTRMWGEDMRLVFGRGIKYGPYISRAFNKQGVPPVVGLYLVVIETEYRNIRSENFAGAAGLFQFIGPTAEAYGVPRSERTNVDKMAPAAARYIADRIAEFGTDPMSVALGIAGYNRSPDSVRRDLHDVLNSQNKERSFWTLVANSTKLDRYFQGENIKYVPKYFAAAIVGETPWVFGLDMRPLSTYTEITAPPESLEADNQ